MFPLKLSSLIWFTYPPEHVWIYLHLTLMHILQNGHFDALCTIQNKSNKICARCLVRFNSLRPWGWGDGGGGGGGGVEGVVGGGGWWMNLQLILNELVLQGRCYVNLESCWWHDMQIVQVMKLQFCSSPYVYHGINICLFIGYIFNSCDSDQINRLPTVGMYIFVFGYFETIFKTDHTC